MQMRHEGTNDTKQDTKNKGGRQNVRSQIHDQAFARHKRAVGQADPASGCDLFFVSCFVLLVPSCRIPSRRRNFR